MYTRLCNLEGPLLSLLPPSFLLSLDMLHSIYHDHCYAKRPPPVTFKLRTTPRKGYVCVCACIRKLVYSLCKDGTDTQHVFT